MDYQPIDQVLKLAKHEGNTVLSISSSELMDKVIWMNNELSQDLRKRIQLEIKGLKYQKTANKPHDPGTEYFVSDEFKTVIIFPLKTAK